MCSAISISASCTRCLRPQSSRDLVLSSNRAYCSWAIWATFEIVWKSLPKIQPIVLGSTGRFTTMYSSSSRARRTSSEFWPITVTVAASLDCWVLKRCTSTLYSSRTRLTFSPFLPMTFPSTGCSTEKTSRCLSLKNCRRSLRRFRRCSRCSSARSLCTWWFKWIRTSFSPRDTACASPTSSTSGGPPSCPASRQAQLAKKSRPLLCTWLRHQTESSDLIHSWSSGSTGTSLLTSWDVSTEGSLLIRRRELR
mmetsp:Transcript_25030/g.56775  ORF Transcript_25030/g.56775 Transcript_25030/m.56775 type:complete len:252 (+) Transcript_25030:352-1107(+)